MAENLSDVHRNLLQLLLGSGALRENDLLELCRQCVDAHKDDARRMGVRMTSDDERDRRTLDRLMTLDINAAVDPFGMKVAKRRHADGNVYFGLVNLRDDAAAKLATPLSKPQQEFAHKLIAAISANENKSINEIDAQNVRTEVAEKLSASDTAACLQRLESGGWLDKSDDVFKLGVRTELQHMYTRDETEVGQA